MQLAHTLEARQQQTQRIDPRQILASEILAWTTAELESAIERELAENPALEVRDEDGFALPSSAFATAQNAPVTLAPNASSLTRTVQDDAGRSFTLTVVEGGVASEDDPLERVASAFTLQEHLRQQVGQVASGMIGELVRYLIECVDDRGYLSINETEALEIFRVPRATLEEAVGALQMMDPPGVGARDLRECLTLQMEFLEQNDEGSPLATRILKQCWEELVTRREDRIAARLRVGKPEVRAAIAYLQRATTPYPGAAFRAAWQHKGAGASPAVRPDIVFHRGEMGFTVELTREFENALTVAPLWKRLSERPERTDDEAMRRYIREHVDRAQTFLTGVARRGHTLRRIAMALIECQQGFLETGNRAFLRPLTRQSIAERLGLDESVISRAVTDKWVQLPGGDVVPLDAFFGNAHAIRDALTQLIASEDPSAPYSDDELADLLSEQGFPLARRTVAKYRSLEKILPARLRRRGGEGPGRISA
ncbi:MAG: RNA polymerase factor sigma-54 [Capsulimonadales bacterium]|nr:RNA polymerase factor sigma-54 [Capsulimonadales bacterium]